MSPTTSEDNPVKLLPSPNSFPNEPVEIAEPLMFGKYLLNERSEIVISSLISDSDFLNKLFHYLWYDE